MRKYRLLPLLFGVSAQQSSTGAEFCSNDNEGCLDSKCCTSEPNFGCYRRRGRAYAACRRTPNGLCDQRSTDWLCPGTWEAMFLACSPRFGACDDTKCCQDPGTYGCYKKTTSTYAQCRPLPDEGIACVDTAEWTCPGKWEDDDVGHQAETTLELLARLGSWETECTDNYGNCLATHCCKDHGYRCFEKKGVYYAQCLPPIRCIPNNETGFLCNDVTNVKINSPPPPWPPALPPAEPPLSPPSPPQLTVPAAPPSPPPLPSSPPPAPPAAPAAVGGGVFFMGIILLLAAACFCATLRFSPKLRALFAPCFARCGAGRLLAGAGGSSGGLTSSAKVGNSSRKAGGEGKSGKAGTGGGAAKCKKATAAKAGSGGVAGGGKAKATSGAKAAAAAGGKAAASAKGAAASGGAGKRKAEGGKKGESGESLLEQGESSSGGRDKKAGKAGSIGGGTAKAKAKPQKTKSAAKESGKGGKRGAKAAVDEDEIGGLIGDLDDL